LRIGQERLTVTRGCEILRARVDDGAISGWEALHFDDGERMGRLLSGCAYQEVRFEESCDDQARCQAALTVEGCTKTMSTLTYYARSHPPAHAGDGGRVRRGAGSPASASTGFESLSRGGHGARQVR